MAEQVARLKILAQIEGLEGFDKLKGAFKGLQQAIGPSDQQLSKARKEILAFGQAGEKTEQVIRGQIEALKALQGQASVSGTVYRQLGKDIKELGGAYREASTGVKQFTDAQLKSQIVGSKPATFGKQIAALKRDLQELSVYSRQYTDTLTEIQRRQLPFNTALGRQGVIAGAQAFAQGGKGGSALPELPDTTAGLNQRLSELTQEFANISRGGERWIQVSREIANVQRQLNQEFANPAFEAARRRLEASRNTNSGFLAFSSGLEDRLAIQKSIERNQRRQPGPQYDSPIGPPVPSELMRSVSAAFGTSAANQAQLMGRSYQEVAASIRQAAAASDGSVVSLRAQRAAWEGLRDTLGNNKAALREVGKELADVDAKLERRTGGGNAFGSRFQTLGAVASGAVFGGPAGLLGAAGGAALGASTGIGSFAGALGGAAVGAAVGGIGQQAAMASNYASEIARLQIALKGVSTDQDEFNKSLKFIEQSAPRFLTSLGDATKNYTRLQASVRGAGMGVGDTQKVFSGLSAAIVATGGGTEQLNAAMLAASQVFSKGKVSAEELRGQIGERLPGAFTIFAQAVNMTPQQLDKALQEGKVSTEDFVRFSEELYKRYGKAAQSIGDSPFAASIRFQLAMDNFKLAAGQALLPAVSAFQNLGTEALNSLVRVIEGTTDWQKAIGNTFDNVMKLIGGVSGLKKILVSLTQTLVVLGTTMAAVFAVQNIGTFVAAFKTVVTVTQTLVKLTRELLTLEKATTALKAIQAGLQAVITAAGTNLKKNPRGVAGVVGAAGVGILAATQFKDDFEKAIDGVFTGISSKFNSLFSMPALGGGFGGNNPQLPSGADPSDPNKAQDEAERLAAEQQRLNEATARAEIELQNAIHRNAMELIRKRHEYQRELQNIELDNWIKGFTGAEKSAAGMISGFLRQIGDLRTRALDADLAVRNAQQQQLSAQAMASVTAGGIPVSSTAIVARTGNTGQSTGAHLDLRWGDGRPISRADADKYFLVNGRAPSSFGVTSGYGPRNLFGRSFHHGIDFGTPAGSAISLRNGATFGRDLGHTGAGGYAIEVMTPEGTMRALHLMANSAMKSGAAGVAAQQRRAVVAGGRAGAEGVDLQAAQQTMQMTQEQIGRLQSAIGSGFVLDFTEQIREQIAAQKDQNFLLEYRNKLEQSGMRPELVDAQLKKAEAARLLTGQLSVANQALQLLEQNGEGNSVQANRLREAIQALVTLYPQLTAAMDANAKKQAELAEKQQQFGERFKKTLQDAYKSATDLGGQLGGALVSGIDGLTNAIVEFASTGKAAFKELASSILKELGAIFIKYAIFKAIFGIFPGLSIGMAATGGATGPGSSAPLKKFATGGVMSNNVVPMRRYASGGIARSPEMAIYGERGPEAYVPLPDGRSIPVKLQQRTDALNRYRPMGSMGGPAADGGEGGDGMSAPRGGGAINVRYESTVINNVEYVTAEQFRAGIQRAAAEGAQRGTQNTLKRLQQSPATRRKVGI